MFGTTDAINVGVIRIDGGTQPREAINEATVRDYAEKLRDGVALPPVTVFFDGAEYWLADGFHRYHATRLNNDSVIRAEIHSGTRRDAVLFSVGANQAHGLQRTNADKRKAVSTLLNDDEWKQWTDSEISRRVGVSHTLVGDVRRGVVNRNKSSLVHCTSEAVEPRTYTTKHGTEATMRTENIGKSESFRSRASVAKRREQLTEMAEGGYTTGQIASALGVTEGAVWQMAKNAGVTIAANAAVGRTTRVDANRILENIVMDAENLTSGVDLITFSALDRERLGAWIESLVQSRRSLDAFIKQLTKEFKNGEAV